MHDRMVGRVDATPHLAGTPRPVAPGRVARLERDGMAWPAHGGAALPPRAGAMWADQRATADPSLNPVAPAWRQVVGQTPLRDLVHTLMLTVVIAAGVQIAVQSRQIEGSSMEPTLHNGQRLLVNRLAYLGLSEPQRGDIIVFRAWGQDEDYIKRVVGVPGDEIEVAGDRVVVNGSPLDEPYIQNHPTHGGPGRVVLGAGTYYVLGDNRDNSSDSRLHGPLASERIVGKAWLTYWPIRDLGFVSDVTSYAAPHP